MGPRTGVCAIPFELSLTQLRYRHDEHIGTGSVYRNLGIQSRAISPQYTDAPELGVEDHGN